MRVRELNQCLETVALYRVCLCGDFNDDLAEPGHYTQGILRSILEKSAFSLSSDLLHTCCVYNAEFASSKLWPFDRVALGEGMRGEETCVVKYAEIASTTFPNPDYPMDHLPLCFSVIMNK
jgi:hypothetical protein